MDTLDISVFTALCPVCGKVAHSNGKSLYCSQSPCEWSELVDVFNKGLPHKFSTTQFNVETCDYSRSQGCPISLLRQMQDRIADADLAADGKEKEFHITVKYGLHTDNVADVIPAVERFSNCVMQLGRTSLFSNDEADVVKIDIVSEDLHELNKAISLQIPCTDTHLKYQPHLTLAYVKPGLGEKYLDMSDVEGMKINGHYLSFCNKEGKEEIIDLFHASDGSFKNVRGTKSTCKQGERSDLTGCDPASGERGTHSQSSSEQETQEIASERKVDVKKNDLPSSVQELEIQSQSGIKRLWSAITRLPGKLIPGPVKRAVSKLKTKAVEWLKRRYGERVAGLIIKAAIISAPIPLPGTQPLTIAVSLLVAESARLVGFIHGEKDLGLSMEEIFKASKQWLAVLERSLKKHVNVKAMSAYGETSGGALVRPPRLKSLIYRTKEIAKGTCEQGERSDLTGCTPASGAGSTPKQETGQENKPKKVSKVKPKASRGAMGEARREGKGKDAKIIMVDGTKAPKHITPSMVPPQWVNVQVALDPKADLLVTARDAKGRIKAVYSDKFHMKTAAWKFAKTEEGLRKFDKMRQENLKNRKSKDVQIRDAADITWLLQEQGTRPGGEDDTKGYADLYDQPFTVDNVQGELVEDAKGKKKSSVKLVFGDRVIPVRDIGAAEQILAKKESGNLEDARYWLQSFGATTLEGRHVVEAEDGVRLQFMGKESVWHDHLIRDPELAQMLVQRKKEPNEKLFQVNAAQLRKYVGDLDGGGFRPKDMRTMLANRLALNEIQKNSDCCSDEKTYKQSVKSLAEKVSHVLGNDPAMALKSYIDPNVFAAWRFKCEDCQEVA